MTFYGKRKTLILLLISFFVFSLTNGCSSKKVDGKSIGQSKPKLGKQIVDILTNIDNEEIIVDIKGNSELIYSAVKEKNPDAIVLYFPDTIVKETLNSPKIINDQGLKKIIFKQENQDAKVRLFLTGDLPYSVNKDGYNLVLKIDKNVDWGYGDKKDNDLAIKETETSNNLEQDKKEAVVEKKDSEEKSKKNKDVIAVSHKKEAQNFKGLFIEEEGDFLKIKIEADGSIRKYNSFTLNNPPRIVFDLVNISSPYKKIQKIETNNIWAKGLRHYDNNSRLRLVIDSRSKWLNNYGAHNVDDGLEIYIGKRDENNLLTADISKENEIKKDAYVTGIDFFALKDGRSKVIISTSDKIDYKAEKAGINRLGIKLLGTKIADYHQRPIITTRFDSAINKIYPVYDNKINNNDSLIYLDLRDEVPFRILDEDDGKIEIVFEASKKEYKEAGVEESPKWANLLGKEKKIPPKNDTTDKIATNKTDSPKKEEVSSKKESTNSVKEEKKPVKPVVAYEAMEKKEPEIKYGEKKYSGQPITLDFYETDIKNVFRIIQHVSSLNFAIDKDVRGKVTMTLKQPVPWDQVLDLILKMNSLAMEREGSIVRVAKLSTLKAEETRKKEMLKAKNESLKEQKNLAPLITEYLLINYSDAESEIQPHLEKIISARGSISVDKRNNQIILTETQENIDIAKEIIKRIDKITPQVVIEARIVEANTNFSKDIGTDWSASSNASEASPYATIYKEALGGNYGYNVAMNTPSASGSIGVNFARITGTPFILNAKLKAMESQKKGKIVSAPKVVTLDNKTATIKQGYEYPYTTIDDGETTTSFKDIDLQLEVTPHVTADNKISLKVDIDKNDLYIETSDGPALSTKNVKTELLVNDGDTIVIGGIIQQSETNDQNRFPILGKIPVVGWLFKNKKDSTVKNELLIFLTPRIVELEQGKF